MNKRMTGTTSGGESFTYWLGARGAPGQGLRIGNDLCAACQHCRVIVRILGFNSKPLALQAAALHSLGWKRIRRTAWLCGAPTTNPGVDCAKAYTGPIDFDAIEGTKPSAAPDPSAQATI